MPLLVWQVESGRFASAEQDLGSVLPDAVAFTFPPRQVSRHPAILFSRRTRLHGPNDVSFECEFDAVFRCRIETITS